MTKLLISVTDTEEAHLAITHGADLIDLKNPLQGALGALPIATIQEVVAYVNANKIYAEQYTSATVGDLPMQADLIRTQVLAVAGTGVDFVKIGFFAAEDYQPCLGSLADIVQNGTKLIAVLFAEMNYPENLIDLIKDAGFYGVMLDTAKKNGATFMDYYSNGEMAILSKRVEDLGMAFGVAGSLNIKHVESAVVFNPTYIGFRGGVSTGNQRTQPLDPEKIKAIRKIL